MDAIVTQPTNLPVINFEHDSILTSDQNRPIVNDLGSIVHILKQNSTDMEKISEIVQKLNKTGSITKVNLFNITDTIKKRKKATKMPKITTTIRTKNVTYIYPYEDSESAKDSKELKVQFVLDCDLKDASGKSKVATTPKPIIQYLHVPTAKPIPTYLNLHQKPIYYPQQQYHVPIRPNYVVQRPLLQHLYRPLAKPTVVTTPKPIVKNVYVDPPAVSAISNAFESVYNYFEDALTTNVVQKESVPSKKTKKAILRKQKVKGKVKGTKTGMIKYSRNRPIVKRSTVGSSRLKPTEAPAHRNPKPSNSKQQLVTQNQVTSVNTQKNPSGQSSRLKSTKRSKAKRRQNDDESEDDDDYYDSISFDGFGLDVSALN